MTMFGRTKIRTRVIALPLLPGAVLGVIVGFDFHRSPATISAAVIAIGLGLSLAVLVATSIAKPLRDLATIALDLHDVRAADGTSTPSDDMLPPRPMRVAGELSELAIAISDGRRHAVEFVAEQRLARRSVTDLVANIALRNERLLGAALDALGEVSRRDHEPATAAAIARIHRIVARVDRSTASSLVLIGEGGRVETVPSSITDVVWAAALAIESSDRVDAMALPDATIHADAVADVGHLLAELIENAVQASCAPGRVALMGAPTDGGSYELTIVDAGSGMGEQGLATANRRVRRLESLHRVPTRNVGLDVVGRLARRHGIQARLGESAQGGVVVRILLPAAILTSPAALPNLFMMPDLGADELHEFAAPHALTPRLDLTQEIGSETTLEVGTIMAEPRLTVVAQPAPTKEAALAVPLVGSVTGTASTTEMPVLAALTPWTVEVPDEIRASSGFAPRPIPNAPKTVAHDRRSAVRLGAADEFLPKRDQRKWAAAIARARS